jgi:choline dehydrogenase-like flavoprotein
MLLDECEVLSLVKNLDRIEEVNIQKNAKAYTLKSRNLALAAGALETPRILFRSSLPNGLANSSGLVGKNLMRHLIDLYVLKASSNKTKGASKQIAFNDFYQIDGGKGGTVQSFGEMPPVKIMMLDLLRDISFHSSIAKWFVQLFSPLIEFFLKRIFKNSVVMASIVEDSPQQTNQVLNTPLQTSFNYQINESDKKRLQTMRNKISTTLNSKIKMKIYSGEKNTLIAHACGTCKMGDDPKKSVINKNCRTHDIKNLYIVDASVFPTSLGVNPALTIAANALRVANELIKNEKVMSEINLNIGEIAIDENNLIHN